MEKFIEKTGRTTDEAIAAALAELRLEREDVTVQVMQLPKSGFLGIGAVPAKVRVTYFVPDEPKPVAPVQPKVEKPAAPKPEKKAEAPKAEAPAAEAPRQEKPAKEEAPVQEKKAEAPKQPKPEKAPKAEKQEKAPVEPKEEDLNAIRTFLTGLLERMGVQAEMQIRPRENGGVIVELSGDDMGAIIGRRGETLDAIQHLTNYVVNKDTDKRLHISVDAEGYRSKREEQLAHLAEKMAAKAIKYKRSMALEPMNSYERHVIHTALQDYEGVTTSSTGTEPNRRVVVSYVKPEGGERSSERSGERKGRGRDRDRKPAAPAPAPEQPKTSASNKPTSREWA